MSNVHRTQTVMFRMKNYHTRHSSPSDAASDHYNAWRLCRCVSLAAITVLLLIVWSARSFAGTLHGQVTTKNGRTSIVGANVSLKGTRYGGVTDGDGNFTVPLLPSGTYTVVVSMLGYLKQERAGIVMPADASAVSSNYVLVETAISIGEVVVLGRANGELETTGRMMEKEANNIVNVITAQAIERSTDRTAADVLQRVSGVSLVRDSQGEGRYVIVRGLEQRYNNTLVDGIKIPSPESKDRFVPMDIFPSSLFQSIEVTKALTPETAGDAIGGSTNMTFRDAPDRFTLKLSASAGYNSGLLTNKLTTFDRTAINVLDPDRMNGMVSDTDPTKLLGPRAAVTANDFTINNLKFIDKQAPPDGMYSAVVASRFFENILGVIASGSYQNSYGRSQTDAFQMTEDINSRDADGVYIPYLDTYSHTVYSSNKTRIGATVKVDYIMDIDQQLALSYLYLRQEEALSRYSSSTALNVPSEASNYEPSYRSALRIQNISNVTLIGNHFTKSPVSFQWTLNYTDATQDRPDEAALNLKVSHDFHGNVITGLHNVTHSWRKNDDKQYLGKTDVNFRITPDGMHALRMGVVVQHLSRVNFQNDYNMNPAILGTGQTGVFTIIDSAKLVPIGLGGNAVFGFQNYNASETVVGSYLQYTLAVGDLQILGGARLENADDRYFTMAPATAGRNEAKIHTTDVLPGIHFRYRFTPEHIGRISITRSMSRPSYFDLVPAQNRQDAESSTGNPDLRAPHSTNIDLRYEYYPNPMEQFSLGVYSKNISDPIEDSFKPGGVNVNTKGNGNSAHVYGAEVVVVHRFGDFGCAFNYSYAYSETQTTKFVHFINADGENTYTSFEQKRPLQSQSDHVGNIIISYDNIDWGMKANVSYNYTGRRLKAVNTWDGYDMYQKPVGYTDVSVEQSILDNVVVSLKGTNIFNSVAEIEIPTGESVHHDTFTIQRDINNVKVTFGIRYNL